MPFNKGVQAITAVTIANATLLSDAVDISGLKFRGLAIRKPESWTSCSITFETGRVALRL